MVFEFEKGLQYQKEKNYDLMKKYYLMAIEKGCGKAMLNLGTHYRYVETNFDLMKKYYLMALEKDQTDAIFYLRSYYRYVEINDYLFSQYELMMNGNIDTIINLASHYQNVEKNHEFMMILSSIAISKGILNKIIV